MFIYYQLNVSSSCQVFSFKSQCKMFRFGLWEAWGRVDRWVLTLLQTLCHLHGRVRGCRCLSGEEGCGPFRLQAFDFFSVVHVADSVKWMDPTAHDTALPAQHPAPSSTSVLVAAILAVGLLRWTHLSVRFTWSPSLRRRLQLHTELNEATH